MVEFASGTESAGHRADHPLACLHPCKRSVIGTKVSDYNCIDALHIIPCRTLYKFMYGIEATLL